MWTYTTQGSIVYTGQDGRAPYMRAREQRETFAAPVCARTVGPPLAMNDPASAGFSDDGTGAKKPAADPKREPPTLDEACASLCASKSLEHRPPPAANVDAGGNVVCNCCSPLVASTQASGSSPAGDGSVAAVVHHDANASW